MIEIENIAVVGGELAIAWSDGKESYLDLDRLRRACPCASCSGEPDALGRVARPETAHGEGAFQLTRYELIGGYALQPFWADGHHSGLYSFDYLRRLGAG